MHGRVSTRIARDRRSPPDARRGSIRSLARGGAHEGRSRRLLPRDGRLRAAVPRARPLSLLRWTDGPGGECLYQKSAPPGPAAVGPHAAHPQRARGARLLRSRRGRRSRHADLSREPRLHLPPPVELHRGRARSSRPAALRPRPDRDRVPRGPQRRHARARPARALPAAELGEDVGRRRAARDGAARARRTASIRC